MSCSSLCEIWKECEPVNFMVHLSVSNDCSGTLAVDPNV
jgi:hypothetical protein